MRLCIVTPDNTIAEVLMKERQPSFEDINNELLFFENYHYKLIIRDSIGHENIELFVGDYSVPLHYNAVVDGYETEKVLIFEGCFDIACISIYAEDKCEEERAFFTDFLRIATTKQTAKKVEQMLEEIEENIPDFLDICFSRNKKKSGLIKNRTRSIWNTLKIVDEIINIYEENYGYFNNHKKASVEPVMTIVDARLMKTIDQESLRWIACNPDNLVLTDKHTEVIIKGKSYMPSKVKTYISKYCYDIYENRVVLGFLENVIKYLESQISGISKEIIELETIPNAIVIQLPNTHELTGRCIYVYYKGIIERFSRKRDMLQTIFYKYEKILECLPLDVYVLPNLTNTFKQVYHYRLCYECMIKWFENGDYTFNHLNYLFKLKTLSRIFEYFCLIKIQNSINQCGYVLQESDRIVYDEEDYTEEINNLYIFKGNGYELTLLYEPSIWVNKLNNNVNLYSTGYNFLKGKWNEKWIPDFVIKIFCNNRDYYYILDAKYSNEINVKKRYMSELVLKYSAQIASKDKFFSDIVGVGAIYPGNEDRMYYFKKNKVDSKKISFPEYFSLTVVAGNQGNNILKERFKKLLGIIDIIEFEKEKIQKSNIVQNNKNVEALRITREDDNNYKQKKNENLLHNIINKKKNYTAVVISGKNCFYYGKSLCLYKKSRCDGEEKSCEHYILKSSRELLKEEYTCRNFICYTKRGKVNRVECSVSGLPGCVGSENCKFCMKKNNKK